MAEHMLKALLQRLQELREEYADKEDQLSCRLIASNVFDVMKCYTVDRREVLNLFGTQELSVKDFQTMKELDYE